jgi:hypothetical protein
MRRIPKSDQRGGNADDHQQHRREHNRELRPPCPLPMLRTNRNRRRRRVLCVELAKRGVDRCIAPRRSWERRLGQPFRLVLLARHLSRLAHSRMNSGNRPLVEPLPKSRRRRGDKAPAA